MMGRLSASIRALAHSWSKAATLRSAMAWLTFGNRNLATSRKRTTDLPLLDCCQKKSSKAWTIGAFDKARYSIRAETVSFANVMNHRLPNKGHYTIASDRGRGRILDQNPLIRIENRYMFK